MRKLFQQWCKRRPTVDETLCRLLLRDRLLLPIVRPEDLATTDDADGSVVLHQLPRGGWSSPLGDVVVLTHMAMRRRARRVLEIGSYRGYTALVLAQNLGPGVRIVTVDRDARHGEAYRQHPCASVIERRVGEMSTALFHADAPGTYDLVFVDAGHQYEEVARDSELVLPLVSRDGIIVWHDYANWGYFNGHNGVPDYLNQLHRGGMPLVRIEGTALAVHSPAWQGRASVGRSKLVTQRATGYDAWSTNELRG